jgi:hypothetical protein
MGYAAFSREEFLAGLFPTLRDAATGHAEAQDYSWGKLNLASDFPQEIVVPRRFPFGPQSKSNSL